MMYPELVPILQCPNSGKSLTLIRDKKAIGKINNDLQFGHLALASGERPLGPVEALLETEDAEYRYPVIGGIPFLLRESSLTERKSRRKSSVFDRQMGEVQQKQMQKFSRMHDRYYTKVTEAQQKILQKFYYPRLDKSSVLDVGNGGLTSDFQLGKEMAKSVKLFVALDCSYAMLTRNGYNDNQLLADTMHIPLACGSVDYILANGLLHHLGLKYGEDPVQVLGRFFAEGRRVSRKGIIVMELVIPRIAEIAEHLLLGLIRFMPTFVYSKVFLLKAFQELNLCISNVIVKRIDDLIKPSTIVPPILDFEWLKIPVFMLPYSFMFFVVNVLS
ncbi:MAG TPA: class I SAM-dependent methyltransferase [Desulfatiglandales bacterium]|nr:class I SAM-dependent methyltransferase [Desulfatiglandales bacterium]